MAQPCCVHSLCSDPSNPFANLSAERPDQELYLGFNSGYGGFEPGIGGTWGSLGCTSFCQSTVSQRDADNCAALQQIACTIGGGTNGGGTGGGGWQNQKGQQQQVFYNGPAACTILCPDGLPFTFRVGSGQFGAPSQAYADAIAQSVACITGQSERMCMNSIDPGTCANEFYADVISTEGGTAPIVYSIVSGNLPPGFSFIQNDEFTVDIEGTCPTPGNYTFSVRAMDRFGVFMVKSYTIEILGFANSPPPTSVGSPYSFQFTVNGGIAPYTFTLTGALPTGLTLSSSGLISGTPTSSATANFSVTVADANQAQCTQPFSITSSPCDCSISWFPSVGACRPRISGYFDGMISNCPLGNASGAPAWDGTLSRWDPPPNNVNGEYAAPITPPATSMAGKVLWAVTLVFDGTNFTLAILGDSSGISTTAWSGRLTSSCPIGTYTRTLGCSAGPATLTLVGYTP